MNYDVFQSLSEHDVMFLLYFFSQGFDPNKADRALYERIRDTLLASYIPEEYELFKTEKIC